MINCQDTFQLIALTLDDKLVSISTHEVRSEALEVARDWWERDQRRDTGPRYKFMFLARPGMITLTLKYVHPARGEMVVERDL